jgi:demethylmenaquinone methyltransferase/2-methoxy-6-polyprenyl-1,4-benzoquinol methylase
MFNGIAARYDLLNHLLSGGIDLYWRRRAFRQVRQPMTGRILDLATGTGDFALGSRRLQPSRIIGVDVALNMLRLGAVKTARVRAGTKPFLLGGDAERLPFVDTSYDLVTVAFGVRNFGSIPVGLAEACRVLRPGGEILVLEFSEPELPLFRQLYRFYFNHILPLVGGIISGNRQAYSYLPKSVVDFPQGDGFLRLLRGAGFVEAEATQLTMGICSIYWGRKPC